MSENLCDAVVDHLFQRMAWHTDHGRSSDEALMLGVQEIRQKLHGSRPDLLEMLIAHALNRVRAVTQTETRWH